MRGNKTNIFVILLFSSFFVYSSVYSKVLISKVQIAGTNTTTDEYVELYNYSSSSINLLNWSLKKRTASGADYSLVSSFSTSTIKPFGYLLVAHRDYCGQVIPDIYYSNASYSLANNNALVLYNEFAEISDEIGWGTISTTYGSPAMSPEPGSSLIRLPNDETGNYIDTDDSSLDLVESTAIPFNSFSPSRPYWEFIDSTSTTSSTAEVSSSTLDNVGGGYDEVLWSFLKINEIMPNPESGEEWVELYNPTTTELILDGGTLCDERTDNCLIANIKGKINAFDWFTILISSSKLNNDGDSVILKDPGENVVDSLTYSDTFVPEKGQTIARVTDGLDTDTISDWAITITPTQNSTNTITAPTPKTIASSGGGGSYVYKTEAAVKPTSTTRTIHIEPVSIQWNFSPQSLTRVNTNTIFDAHLSADPRGGAVSFLWNFGDGSYDSGEKTYHSYATSGIYTVTISATSTQNTTGSTKFLIKVAPENSISEQIFLYEIAPAPESGEDEFIILKSRANTSTDLGGWKLGTGEKWFTIPPGTNITPGETLRFYRTASKIALNNAESNVYLSAPDGKIVDLVSYSGGKKGQNYTLTSSTWEWLPKTDTDNEKTRATRVAGIRIASASYFKPYTVADLHSLEPGSSVRIEGIVESTPGSIGSNYFYLRDSSGGIQVYSYKKDFPKLDVGNKIIVKGEIGVYQGANRIKIKAASDIRVVSSTTIIPEQRKISEIDENDFGTLVSLEGEITELKTNYFYLDDGIAEGIAYLSTKAGIEKPQLREGETVKVTGIIERTSSGWRLSPRGMFDISFLKSREIDLKQMPAKSNKNLIITVCGSLLLFGIFLAKRLKARPASK